MASDITLMAVFSCDGKLVALQLPPDSAPPAGRADKNVDVPSAQLQALPGQRLVSVSAPRIVLEWEPGEIFAAVSEMYESTSIDLTLPTRRKKGKK